MSTPAGDRTAWWHSNAWAWERIVGTVAGVAVGAALVSSRTISYTMPALAIATLAGLFLQRRLGAFRPSVALPEWVAIAFLFYATLSLSWAFKPSAGVVPVITALGYLFGYIFVTSVLNAEPRYVTRRIAEGFCLGLVFGLAYLAYEILTDQSLKLAIYKALHLPKTWLRPTRDFTWVNNELVAIAPSDLKRNIAPIALLVWSALLMLRSSASSGQIKRAGAALLFAAVAFVILKSDHETSKAALLWSSGIFLLARFSARASRRVLQAAWVIGCLAPVPLALAAHHFDLHNSHLFQDSFRHRIIIWNHTAEETLKTPVLGIGAGMMYQIDPQSVVREADEDFSRTAPHAHNVYLQTWFELGFVGALFLTFFGLVVIETLQRLPHPVIPFAQATFASVMMMIAASYGMWEPWFIAMFAMSAVMCASAIRLQGADADVAPRAPGPGPRVPSEDVPIS